MAGKETSAGRVLLIPKGVFTSGTNYTPLDFVAFGSNNYVCKKSTDGTKTPVEDTASWQMLAAGFDSHNIAVEYSEEATYHTGDICISGGNLYKAKQDIDVAEAFTAGHWEEITIGQELMSLETSKADASDVATLKEKVGSNALTTTATDLSGAVNEVKEATATNASAITQLNSNLGGFRILAAGKSARFFLTAFNANTSEIQKITVPNHGQKSIFVATSLLLEGTQPRNLQHRILNVTPTSFEISCETLVGLNASTVVYVEYIVLASS